MQDRKQSTAVLPENAFSGAFLQRFARSDEAPTVKEAESAGPWEVHPVASGFGVWRLGEDPGRNPAAGTFASRELALIAAAMLPGVGRDALLALSSERRPEGYELTTFWGESGARSAGFLPAFEPEMATALHLGESLIRSPVALAALLEAAGATALQLAGRILARRL